MKNNYSLNSLFDQIKTRVIPGTGGTDDRRVSDEIIWEYEPIRDEGYLIHTDAPLSVSCDDKETTGGPEACLCRIRRMAEAEKAEWLALAELAGDRLCDHGFQLIEKAYFEAWQQASEIDRERVNAILSALPSAYMNINTFADNLFTTELREQMKEISRSAARRFIGEDPGGEKDHPQPEDLFMQKLNAADAGNIIDPLFGTAQWEDFRWRQSPLPVSYTHANEEFLKDALDAAERSLKKCAADNTAVARELIETISEARRLQLQRVITDASGENSNQE